MERVLSTAEKWRMLWHHGMVCVCVCVIIMKKDDKAIKEHLFLH